MDTLEEYITVDETLRRFGIRRTKFYELIRSGEIEAVKMGTRTLVRIESARSYFDSLPRLGGRA